MQPTLLERVKYLHLNEIRKHIFLCCDQTQPKCCSKEAGLTAWEHLKNRLHTINRPDIYRSKVNCLRVCQKGPIAVVYPDGIWYHSCGIDVLDRIIDEHLVGGKPVDDYIIAR